MHKRSTAMRLAAAAIILTLAAPVSATEIEMKKKEDPKAQKAAAADGKKAGETSTQPKKNCPENEFNTLEDLFGAVGPLDPVTGLPALPAAQAAASTPAVPAASQGPAKAAAKPAAPAVEWRAVEATDKTANPKPKPESEEKK